MPCMWSRGSDDSGWGKWRTNECSAGRDTQARRIDDVEIIEKIYTVYPDSGGGGRDTFLDHTEYTGQCEDF